MSFPADVFLAQCPVCRACGEAVQCTYPVTSELKEKGSKRPDSASIAGDCCWGQSYSNDRKTALRGRLYNVQCTYSHYTSLASPVGRLFFSIYWHRYFYDIQRQAERIKKSIRFLPLSVLQRLVGECVGKCTNSGQLHCAYSVLTASDLQFNKCQVRQTLGGLRLPTLSMAASVWGTMSAVLLWTSTSAVSAIAFAVEYNEEDELSSYQWVCVCVWPF